MSAASSANPRDKNHPVWVLYDLRRTARYDAKVLSVELNKLKRTSFWMDVFIALSTTSAVAVLWLWQDPIGKEAWKVVGAIAAVLSIMRPMLGFSDKISLYQELLAGYRVLEFDCTLISDDVQSRKAYDADCIRRLGFAQARLGTLIARAGSKSESSLTLKKRCQAEVNKEMPPESFYIPP